MIPNFLKEEYKRLRRNKTFRDPEKKRHSFNRYVIDDFFGFEIVCVRESENGYSMFMSEIGEYL